MQITEEDRRKLEKLAKRIGAENAKTLLTVLGRDKVFLDAFQSPLGQELLKDVIFAIEDKLSLILNEKDKPKDRSELKAYQTILRSWSGRIKKYNQNKEKLMKELGR